VSQPEHRVRLLPAAPGNGETLRFEIDGKPKGGTIRIGQLSRALVANLPDEALDLIEIAALVYAVDASETRGGPTDNRLAEAWYRRFVLEVPVRSLQLWTDPEVRRELEETLAFLSADRFEFVFRSTGDPAFGATRFFEFGDADSWLPDAVMLFSGSLAEKPWSERSSPIQSRTIFSTIGSNGKNAVVKDLPYLVATVRASKWTQL
jgi:hypothetical protein